MQPDNRTSEQMSAQEARLKLADFMADLKKPKKSKEVIVPAGFITPAKPSLPAKK